MSTPNHCFEIVHFAFGTDVPFEAQVSAMRALDAWVVTQPGFVSRRCFHDSTARRWTDVIEWTTRGDAEAAMARSTHAPEAARVFALIDGASVQAGHFERIV